MKRAAFSIIASIALLGGTAFAGQTLDAVRSKGFIQCGVSQGLPGFSNPDDKGGWSGIDVDYCRALAAAVFADAAKVRYTPLSAQQRFTALQTGEIDVLSRNTTWTQSRDAGLGINFVGVVYHDGQGFMVKKAVNVKSAKELDGATVCMNSGTTTELNAADYFRSNKLKFTPVTFEKSDETVFAYDAGRCDVYSTDQSGLYAQRIKLKQPNDHVILPEIISKEPLGPVVRQGDEEWFDIARWTLFALINAGEFCITSKNVDGMTASTNPEIRRFLGAEGELGKGLGLAKEWAFNIVKQVGNYGEVFEKNLGQASPLKIERGVNAPWNQGGILFAPPIR